MYNFLVLVWLILKAKDKGDNYIGVKIWKFFVLGYPKIPITKLLVAKLKLISLSSLGKFRDNLTY